MWIAIAAFSLLAVLQVASSFQRKVGQPAGVAHCRATHLRQGMFNKITGFFKDIFTVPEPEPPFKAQVNVEEKEWRARLTDDEFYVLRQAGTERPFTSSLNNEKRTGSYICKGCGSSLFLSSTKFNSGTGWPSFFAPVPTAISERTDSLLMLQRTEVLCSNCGGHLGHVFKDGPRPTGLRYCINGISLRFKAADETGTQSDNLKNVFKE